MAGSEKREWLRLDSSFWLGLCLHLPKEERGGGGGLEYRGESNDHSRSIKDRRTQRTRGGRRDVGALSYFPSFLFSSPPLALLLFPVIQMLPFEIALLIASVSPNQHSARERACWRVSLVSLKTLFPFWLSVGKGL